MNRVTRSVVLMCAFLAVAFSFCAQAAEDEATAKVRQNLSANLPDTNFGEITATPIPGLYEVVIGHQLAYVSENGRYLLQGTLFDVAQRRDLTEPRVEAIKSKVITSLNEETMVIFAPEKSKYNVTVFTDIDCGYCRKLHSEIDQYMAQGIRIRYLFIRVRVLAAALITRRFQSGVQMIARRR